jgi:FkbM family methyltransferase
MDSMHSMRRRAVELCRVGAFKVLTSVSAPTLPAGVRDRASALNCVPCRVLTGDLRGRQFLNPVGQRSPAYCIGRFERHLAEAMADLVPVGGVAFDIGANVGWHTIRLSQLVGGDGLVVAFEPSERDREILRANLGINGVANVVIDSRAVFSDTGSVSFATFDVPGVGHVVRGDTPSDANVTTVASVTIDDLVFIEGVRAPNFVKVDIEGGELAAVEGASRVLTEIRPAVAVELRRGPLWNQVAAEFQQRDYSMTVLAGDEYLADVLFVPG